MAKENKDISFLLFHILIHLEELIPSMGFRLLHTQALKYSKIFRKEMGAENNFQMRFGVGFWAFSPMISGVLLEDFSHLQCVPKMKFQSSEDKRTKQAWIR